jgi:hypothetical protein
MSPVSEILNPRGNLSLGLSAAFLLLSDFFLSTKFLRLSILPMLLADVFKP